MNTTAIKEVLTYIIDNEEKHFVESFNSGDNDGWKGHIYLHALQTAEDLELYDFIPELFTLAVEGGDDPEFKEQGEYIFKLELLVPGRPVSGTDGGADGVAGLIAFLNNEYPQTEFFRVVSIEGVA